MPRPRVSVAGLMASVFLMGIGFASLKYSSEGVAGLVVLATMIGLAVATLAVVYRREGRRAFWLGFAGLGWGYLALSSSSWVADTESHATSSFPTQGFGVAPVAVERADRRPVLVTTFLLDSLRPRLQAGPNASGTAISNAGTDAFSRRIAAELNKPLSMPFPNETPFEDILKYIAMATTGPGLERGIPIYVDPAGLQEAEKSMKSPVTLNLEGIPLRKSLKLVLSQLDLTFTVNEGLLAITSKITLATARETQIESFRRVGHCLLAMLFALLGGCVGRILHATRDRE